MRREVAMVETGGGTGGTMRRGVATVETVMAGWVGGPVKSGPLTSPRVTAGWASVDATVGETVAQGTARA